MKTHGTLISALILLSSLGGAALLFATGPTAAPQEVERTPTLVDVSRVHLAQNRAMVRSQGTVRSHSEVELSAEVPGRVQWISDRLESGTFFSKGDVLARIGAEDYRLAVLESRARVGRAEAHEAEALSNHRRLITLGKQGIVSLSQLEEAERAAMVATADLDAMRAALHRSEEQLRKAAIRAPFNGRVRERHFGVGQYARPGDSIASIFAVDYVEIRLPIPDRDLATLGISLGSSVPTLPIEVNLRAKFAGQTNQWTAAVVRIEGEVDPSSRMATLVARIAKPYADAGEESPSLAVGTFVEAEIFGPTIDGTATLPRSAFFSSHSVIVVDAQGMTSAREVTILRESGDQVIISAGLQADELFCTRPPVGLTPGTRVSISEERAKLSYRGGPAI